MGWRMCKSTFVITPYLLTLVISLVYWSAPTVAQEQPRYGGTMVLATFADPGSLNPGLTTSVPTHLVTGPIFSGLVGHDFQLTLFQISPSAGRFPRMAGSTPSIWCDMLCGTTAGDGCRRQIHF